MFQVFFLLICKDQKSLKHQNSTTERTFKVWRQNEAAQMVIKWNFLRRRLNRKLHKAIQRTTVVANGLSEVC